LLSWIFTERYGGKTRRSSGWAVFKRRVIEVARGLRSSLSPSAVNQGQVQRLASLENQLKKRTGELERARRQLADRDRELAELRGKVPAGDAAPVDGLRPENVVWIFGTGGSAARG